MIDADGSDGLPSSLEALRDGVEALASDDGAFVVACARTGESPVPVDGHRFPDRDAAARAVEYAVAYRERLRLLDSRIPGYDPVVHESITAVGTDVAPVPPTSPPTEPVGGSGFRNW